LDIVSALETLAKLIQFIAVAF